MGKIAEDASMQSAFDHFCDDLLKKPAALGFIACGITILLATLAWRSLIENGIPDGEITIRSTAVPLQPSTPPVFVVTPPSPVVIVVAPAPAQPCQPTPPVVVVPPATPPSTTSVVVTTLPAPAPPASAPIPTVKCRASTSFCDGLYGGFELVCADGVKKIVTVKPPTMNQLQEIDVPTVDDVQVFTTNDLLGDFSHLRPGQRLSMYLKKNGNNELVASAIFIERHR